LGMRGDSIWGIMLTQWKGTACRRKRVGKEKEPWPGV